MPGDTHRRQRREGGAVLVEMALLLPLLMVLLIGMMEAGWAFSNLLDVRHASREGARLAAVSAGNSTWLRDETCLRMKASLRPNTQVALNPAGGQIGNDGTIQVVTNHQPLTNFLNFAFGSITFNEINTFRLEQNATWSNMALSSCP